jgi:signal transduction histidine kinase
VDGISLCRALHAHTPELPVIVVTGFSDTASAVRALHAGAEDYLIKPVDFDDLLLSIQRAIERRAASVERQQLRTRAEELSRQALAAVDAHREVLSIVAHDLRNPLGVIVLWTQQLLRAEPELLGANVERGLSAISRSAARMQRLIADLMDESRIRTGHLPLDCRRHAISQLLADVAELRPLAQQKRVSIDIVPPERDRSISCDRGRVNQVLGNLLTNAIKFSPQGSTVTLSVEDDGTAVAFAVHDQGPGMSPDDLSKVFERFWQQEQGNHGGMGLGLYIVKGIVEAHGGHVSVESALGGGTTFRVSLPAACACREAPESEREAPESEPRALATDFTPTRLPLQPSSKYGT